MINPAIVALWRDCSESAEAIERYDGAVYVQYNPGVPTGITVAGIDIPTLREIVLVFNRDACGPRRRVARRSLVHLFQQRRRQIQGHSLEAEEIGVLVLEIVNVVQERRAMIVAWVGTGEMTVAFLELERVRQRW